MKLFSHVSNFTGYMEVVFRLFDNMPPQRILDIPAGNGLLAERLRTNGHEVICADINNEKENYVYANLEDKLPFNDGEFDTVICLEGVEHVLYPANLVAELCRITKKGGRIILSTPNIQSIYSRLCFLFTGELYQFSCLGMVNPIQESKSTEMAIDRGHISPMGYYQLLYLFKLQQSKIMKVAGDRVKKKIFMPLYFIIAGINFLMVKMSKRGAAEDYRFSTAYGLLFSRSLVLEFLKIEN